MHLLHPPLQSQLRRLHRPRQSQSLLRRQPQFLLRHQSRLKLQFLLHQPQLLCRSLLLLLRLRLRPFVPLLHLSDSPRHPPSRVPSRRLLRSPLQCARQPPRRPRHPLLQLVLHLRP